MHWQDASSSADLIRAGWKPEHRDVFANQCHRPTHTHTQRPHTVILQSVLARVHVSK